MGELVVIGLIKEELRKKYGHEILYAKDCQNLSESILRHINRQVSVTTLKRFFGIVNSPFNPSKYTLDTLAIYLDFKNWEDFLNTFEGKLPDSSGRTPWTQLRERAQMITNYSLQSIKAKIGDELPDIPARDFSIKKFDSFLSSPQTATAFIAPAGFGKSTIVAQLTKMFFTGDDAKYPNDIVFLIDGSILVNLVNLNTGVIRIQNLLAFDPKNSFSNYFRERPEQVGGRFILIIDGLNEIYYQQEKLTRFIENLMDIVTSYEGVDWVKLLITCRPDNWRIFMNIVQKNPRLKAKWLNVSFEGALTDTINIPLLNEQEIEYYLEKKHSPQDYQNLNFHYPDITKLINTPYFLHLLQKIHDPENIYTDIELLNRFVYNEVLSAPYSGEKSEIINSLLLASNYAKQNTSVKKDDLPELTEFNDAYKDLIVNNILYEYTIPGSYLSFVTYVKFPNDTLLEFFLANEWMKNNEFNLDLFYKVLSYYKNNTQFQGNIIKYLIKFAFKEGNKKILENIYSIFESKEKDVGPGYMSTIDPEIINVIGVELRKNKLLRDYLMPIFAKSKSGRLFYFESFFDMDSLVLHSGNNVNYYLENKHSDDAIIYGHFLKFLQHFLASDQPNCQKEYEVFQQLKLPVHIKPMLAGFYHAVPVIYQTVFTDGLDNKLIRQIYKTGNHLFNSGQQPRTSVPSFEFSIVFSLNYGDRFAEIIDLSNLVFERYELAAFTSTWLYHLFQSVYARALLNTGETKKALEIFNQVEVEFRTIPVNSKYYMKLRYYLIQIEFLIFEGKLDKAKQVIDNMKTISQMLRFKLFYDKALQFENMILGKSE